MRMLFRSAKGSGDNASTSRCVPSVGMGKVQASIALLLGLEGQFPSHEAPPTSNSHPIISPLHTRTGSSTQPLIFPDT